MITTTIGNAGFGFLALYFFLAGVMGTALGFGFSAAGALALVLLGARMGYPLLLCLSIINLLFTMRLLGAQMAPISKWGEHGQWRYLVGGCLGAPMGLYLLLAASQGVLKMVLGGFILACAVYFIFRPHSHDQKDEAAGGPATGVFIGVLGGLAGGFSAFPTAPLVAWLRFKNVGKKRLLSVTQPFALSMQVLCLAIATFENPDLWSQKMLLTLAWCVPSTLLGTWIGAKVFRVMSEKAHAKVTAWALLACGASIMMATSGGASGLAGAVAKHDPAGSQQAVETMGVALEKARGSHMATTHLAFDEGESRLGAHARMELDRAWSRAMGAGDGAARMRVAIPVPGAYEARSAMERLGPAREGEVRKYLSSKARLDGVEALFEHSLESHGKGGAGNKPFAPSRLAEEMCLPSPARVAVEMSLARAKEAR